MATACAFAAAGAGGAAANSVAGIRKSIENAAAPDMIDRKRAARMSARYQQTRPASLSDAARIARPSG